MTMRCMNTYGGSNCPRPAHVVVKLAVPGHEATPVAMPRCVEHAAWLKADWAKRYADLDMEVVPLAQPITAQ